MASYTSISVRSRSAARNAALSVRSSRSVVSRAAASGWSTTRTSMAVTLVEPVDPDGRPNACSPIPMPSAPSAPPARPRPPTLPPSRRRCRRCRVPRRPPLLGPVGAGFLAALADAAAIESRAVAALRDTVAAAGTTARRFGGRLCRRRPARRRPAEYRWRSGAERVGRGLGGADPRGAGDGRPGWSGDPATDPAAMLGGVRDALADVSAAAARAWSSGRRALVGRGSRWRGRLRGGDRRGCGCAGDACRRAGGERRNARRRRWRGPARGCGQSSNVSRPAPRHWSRTWTPPASRKNCWREAQRALAEAIARGRGAAGGTGRARGAP